MQWIPLDKPRDTGLTERTKISIYPEISLNLFLGANGQMFSSQCLMLHPSLHISGLKMLSVLIVIEFAKHLRNVKAHIRSHHLKSAAYKCPVCNKSFGAPYALNQHRKSHEEGGRKFFCAICGKGFVSKSQVNEHSKRHLQRRVTCAHCSKSVADKRTLQSHLRICSKHPQPLQQDLPQTEEQARPYKCDHCFRHYVHKRDLMCHQRQKHQDKL